MPAAQLEPPPAALDSAAAVDDGFGGPAATQEHCRFCFDVLVAQLDGTSLPAPPAECGDWEWCVIWMQVLQRMPVLPATCNNRLQQLVLSDVCCFSLHSPLFVTWNKASNNGHYSLRGCIGTLEPRLLRNALRDYALTRHARPASLDEPAS
jgi:AMMECR1 domain-containing protein